MRYLYYCNSAYQLINILNLNWNRKYAGFEHIDGYEGDLLILNAFYGAERMAEIVKARNEFARVILIEKAKDNKGAFHLINSFADIAFPGSFLKRKFGLDRKLMRYDVLTAPKFSRVIGAIWQLNKNAKLELYEDGLASYYLDYDLILSRSKSYKLLYKPLNHGRNFLDFSSIYLSSPELFTGNFRERVKELPKFDRRYLEEIKESFKEYSGFDDEKDKDIFWFSQSMFDDSEVLKVLEDYLDDVLFCPHPRYPVDSDVFQVSRKNQIWEMKALSMDNLDDKCLITIHSTALMTPKLLFDKEPYLIFVCKIVPLPYEYDFYGRSLDLFKKSYTDPERVMMPETMDEFKECLKKVLKEIKANEKE